MFYTPWPEGSANWNYRNLENWYIYIYIYIERERERDIILFIRIYIYTYIHIFVLLLLYVFINRMVLVRESNLTPYDPGPDCETAMRDARSMYASAMLSDIVSEPPMGEWIKLLRMQHLPARLQLLDFLRRACEHRPWRRCIEFSANRSRKTS